MPLFLGRLSLLSWTAVTVVSSILSRRCCHCYNVSPLPSSTTATAVSCEQNNMLLRIRTNLGTWKHVCSTENNPPLSAVLAEVCREKACRITQAVSRDPSGKDILYTDRSLNDLGLTRDGEMIYCRVAKEQQEDTRDGMAPLLREDNSKAPVPSMTSSDVTLRKPAASLISQNSSTAIHRKPSASKMVGNNRPVIELLDSDDDDEDDEVIPISPPPAIAQKRGPASSNGGKAPKRSRPLQSLSSAKVAPSSQSSSLVDVHPSTFQIVSYNAWFGPNDPDARQVHPKERMAAICQELQTCCCQGNLLFVGFQELTPNMKEYLAPHLNAMGFRLCTQPLGSAYGVGLAISKMLPIVESKFCPFEESCQGRGILYVQTPTMIFATTHLESFLDKQRYDGSAQREAQIAQATSFCQERMREYPHLKVAVVAGDFNWDDERVRMKGPNRPLIEVVPGWKDAGQPFDYTYDGKENPMLGGNLRRRFDRCIYFTNEKNGATPITATLEKIGMNAIPNLTWNKKNPWNGTSKTVPVAPSDHFGIAVTFSS